MRQETKRMLRFYFRVRFEVLGAVPLGSLRLGLDPLPRTSDDCLRRI
jgi:hypothetical protein